MLIFKIYLNEYSYYLIFAEGDKNNGPKHKVLDRYFINLINPYDYSLINNQASSNLPE